MGFRFHGWCKPSFKLKAFFGFSIGLTSMLLKNGFVVDGTGAPGRRTDVLVEGEVIARLGRDLESGSATADEVFDADGLVVCPGFVDVHSHWDLACLAAPDMAPVVAQGVTTTTGGMCGFGLAPSNPLVEDYYAKLASRLLSVKPCLCADFDALARAIEENGGISANLAYFVPHGNVRALRFGAADAPATPEDLEWMKGVVRAHMQAGAFGMSTGLVYPPGSVSTTDELVELAKVVAEYDGLYASHVRNEGAGVLDVGLAEVFRIAREAGVRAHVAHWSVISSRVEELVPKVLQAVRNARSEGLDVTADVTAYDDAVTPLAFVLLPTWVFEDFERNLSDPATRARILDEIFEKVYSIFLADAPWHIRAIPKFLLRRLVFPVLAKRVTILSCTNNRSLQGTTVHQAIRRLYPGVNVRDGLLNLLRDEEGGILITLRTKDEERGVRPLFSEPHVSPSSDAIPVVDQRQNVHPRNYGTFPRVLQRWVREKGWVPLEEAVRKMTSLPAGVLRLRDRGTVARGMAADLVAFDQEEVAESGTLEDGRRFPVGIRLVVVNGVVTIRDGRHVGARAGKLLRRA
ncbi:MAG: D-aminoacylase [Promethearchaeota archaeon]